MYYKISEEEMRNFLHKWEEITKMGEELSFQYAVWNGIFIRAYTSISGGRAKGCGKDAIRIFAYDSKTGRGYIRTRRVYRTDNWQKNFIKAYTKVLAEVKERLIKDKRLSVKPKKEAV